MNDQRSGQPHPVHPQHPSQPALHVPPQRMGMPTNSVARAVTAPATHAPTAEELEPISLVEDELSAGPTMLTQQQAPAPKKIVAMGGDLHHKQHDWKRTPYKSGMGAVRVKSFHGKYSEQGLEYLDNAINEWLDGHPEVEVKFVTPTVMTFEGKIREPALVLNVWY